MNCDMEAIEQSLEERRHVQVVLGMDFEQYERVKDNAMQGLVEFGGNFENAFGLLLTFCDVKRSVKLMHTFKQEITEYELMWRIKLAKDKALNQS